MAAHPPHAELALIQITANGTDLFGLDASGKVWKYIPANKTRFSFWTALTAHIAVRQQTSPTEQPA